MAKIKTLTDYELDLKISKFKEVTEKDPSDKKTKKLYKKYIKERESRDEATRMLSIDNLAQAPFEHTTVLPSPKVEGQSSGFQNEIKEVELDFSKQSLKQSLPKTNFAPKSNTPPKKSKKILITSIIIIIVLVLLFALKD